MAKASKSMRAHMEERGFITSGEYGRRQSPPLTAKYVNWLCHAGRLDYEKAGAWRFIRPDATISPIKGLGGRQRKT